ncbi:MAG: GNAT family N-acetyltransferase [Promethearchaeota archaeon]|jgi:ribosomal protein S18 acetylase RimI-like enzyme
MENIIIRSYKKGDEKDLADLFNIAFQKGGGFIRTPKSWYWRFVQSPGFEPKMCQIAEDINKKKIVGAVYANLIEFTPLRGKKYLVGDINDVSCHPDYTRQGIATTLMKKSINYMVEKGCDFSLLSTDFKGFARNKIYIKLGYKDVDREDFLIQFPYPFQIIRDFYALGIFLPILLSISYIPRILNRIRIRRNRFFNDFSYEINFDKKHGEFMKAVNQITPKYYEGYPEYSFSKFSWARIKVPAKRQKPTYIIVKKGKKIIGGAVLTHQNIYMFKFGLKLRIGVIHDIFLDVAYFKNKRDLHLGYIYLIDKIIKAASKKFIGVLIYTSPQKAKRLIKGFQGMNFFKIQNDVVMVKELKPNIKFPQIDKPLYIPTYISLGVP